MKEGWTYKKLGEVCQSDLGKTLNQSKDTGALRPYLCAINILWDKIDLSTLKQTKFEDSELERYSVRKGDLLVCEGGDIGRAAIWDKEEPIQYQNALHRIRFNEEIYPRFCLLYLRSLKQRGILDHKYAKGVTILHLVKSSLLSIPIPIPAIIDQQQIVSELDLLSDVIKKQKTQIDELDKLAQSTFYDMFGDPVTNDKNWEKTELGKTCIYITDGDHMPPPKAKFGVPFITISNIDKVNRDILFDDTFYVPIGYYNSLKEEKKAKNGDVLYTVTGSYGIPVVIKSDNKFCFQRHIALLRPDKEKLNTSFLCYWVLCDSVKHMADDVATGIAQKTVGLSSLRRFSIILPPLALQQEFAAKVEAIEQMKAKVRQSLKESEELFNSRMDYYFN